MTDSKVKVTSKKLNPDGSETITVAASDSILNSPLNATSLGTVPSIQKSTFPTNVVQLASKGLLYPEDHPLRQGTIEVKYMTAKEENILTTESYIRSGVVIDKFLQSIILSPKFNYDDLLIGDKDSLIIASRIYGYGEIYPIEVTAPSGRKQKIEVNLETIENKEVDDSLFVNGNEFSFTTPKGNNVIVFKLLTVRDQKKIDETLKKYKKADAPDTQITTRLTQMITSVDGNSDPMYIRLFVENDLRVQDSRAFREYVASIQPGPNMEIEVIDEETGDSFRTQITLGPNFFWPDLEV